MSASTPRDEAALMENFGRSPPKSPSTMNSKAHRNSTSVQPRNAQRLNQFGKHRQPEEIGEQSQNDRQGGHPAEPNGRKKVAGAKRQKAENQTERGTQDRRSDLSLRMKQRVVARLAFSAPTLIVDEVVER